MSYRSGKNRELEAAIAAGGKTSLGKTAAIGGALLGATILVDRLGGDTRWRETAASFQFETPEEEITNTDVVWVVFPGLGQKSSRPAARAVAPVLDAPTVSMNLPQKRPSLERVRQTFSDFVMAHGVRRIRPYFSSMGNFLAADLLPALPEEVDIDRGVFDGSPGGSHHAKQGDRVPKLVSRVGYPGGLLTKPIAAAAGYQPHPDRPDEVGWRYNLREAWKSVSRTGTPNGSSSMLWVWQAQRLCDPDPGRVGRNIGARLTPDARLAYIMPTRPERDVVVDVVGSHELLEHSLGRRIDPLAIDGITHSWPTEYATAYQETIGEWLGQGALRGQVDIAAIA
jgi:hypothetical protein